MIIHKFFLSSFRRKVNNLNIFKGRNTKNLYYSTINCNIIKNEISLKEDSLKPHWINIDNNKKLKNKCVDVTYKNEEANLQNNEYLYISKKSKMMKYIIRLRKKKNFRKKNNSFFVKDSNTILHLSKNKNIHFEAVLGTNKDILKIFKNMQCTKLYYINKDILNYIFSDTLNVKRQDKNDAVAIIKIPHLPNKIDNIKFLLVLDRIRYAYNLGKILNVAYSMNVDCLYYTKHTADPYNPKVMEITKGTHLNIPHIFGNYQKLEQLCKEQKLIPIVAHTNGQNIDTFLKKKNNINGICLILGSESTGPHTDVFKYAHPVHLPMHEMTNSLNVFVAASILIHYIKKCCL
ncbi:RNA methyltransferase, putative [Plasmodium sp. gorilla clade G3]|nr:RNA methyltransferase, putative [Plasmodium sp. gorilla clade G3]